MNKDKKIRFLFHFLENRVSLMPASHKYPSPAVKEPSVYDGKKKIHSRRIYIDLKKEGLDNQKKRKL